MYTKTDEVDENGQPILEKTITTEAVVKVSYAVLKNTVDNLQIQFDDISTRLNTAKDDLSAADAAIAQ